MKIAIPDISIFVIFNLRMCSCLGLTIRFRNEPVDFGHQFFTHSDIIQERNEPAFDLHGMYQGGDYAVFGLHDLIYD